ncbi:carboxypeptidase B-like isoform X2 [Coccinella septempunctata]|uniref:carboxypeptidase B-like isoform X2 n=1 Tax=Coccinella septempunctata TaxID=41139 RepID=UPI001D07AD8E|nr:carboxypeptidase B-like isoform X2 [Coccinella septempunctata]
MMMRLVTLVLTVLVASPGVRPRNIANPGSQVYPDLDLMMDFSARPTPKNLNQTMDEGPFERVMYNNSQVWKACNEDDKFLIELNGLRRENRITMWGGNLTCIDIMVRGQHIEEVSESFARHNVDYSVIIEDLQKAIDEENPPLEALELDNRQGHRLTWQAYHRLYDIHGYLDYLAETYPQLCTVKTIGSSVQGRPIKLLKISNGNQGNKAVWIDGGVHAREWISPATVTFIINQIVLSYDNDPLLEGVDWYITPVVNPDGYEYSHNVDRLWRKNRRGSGFCAGTDLNRNFGHGWGGQGASGNPCTETYRGATAFSEPETSAIRNFISQNKVPWKVYISFHSYGQYILYPWGYDRTLPADYQDLDRVGKKAVAAIQQAGGPRYSLGSSGRLLYPASGGSDDWAKGKMGIKYSYTLELRDNGRYGFVLPATYIQPTAKEAYAAVRAIVSEA